MPTEGLFPSTLEGGKARSELLKEFKFEEEEREILENQYGKTGFPQPLKSYRLSWEVNDLSLEEPYYWVLDTLKDGFPIVEKIEDTFGTAEASAFFGHTQTRLGAQQDKVSQLLATSGQMIKQLFQIVRELRIIDERLTYYEESARETQKEFTKRGKSAEVTLKGIFVDLVQGGGKSTASVFGMSRELEFITLPDLFFDAPPFQSVSEMEGWVGSLEKNFNQNVLRVLLRHLRQFMEWKLRTHQEHRSRKQFQLAYLRQHFEIIKMYVTWIKPYLRYISRLQLKEKSQRSAELVLGFEGTLLDVEILARRREVYGKVFDEEKKEEKELGVNGCILVTFNYRTRSELKVVLEGYQRGPVQIGRMEMNIRVYYWTDEVVEKYKKLKDKETLVLMGTVSKAVEEAMNSLGSQLDNYLAEAAGQVEQKVEEPKAKEKKPLAERWFGDFYTPKSKKDKKEPSVKEAKGWEASIKQKKAPLVLAAKAVAWATYHNFKKAHGMIAW